MHNNFSQIYCFIDNFNKDNIQKLDKNITIIYRNYSKPYTEDKILEIKKYCKKAGRKFYLANNVALVDKLNIKGVYIPSFNRKLDVLKLKKKNIHTLGSAHNLKEIFQKKKQRIDVIFLSPLFKVTKKSNFLGISKFKNLANHVNEKVVALGGINNQNIKKIRILNCYGFASISYFNI